MTSGTPGRQSSCRACRREWGCSLSHLEHANAPRDHVEISPLGKMLDGIGQLPEIRHERVDEIRRQIAAGSYETPEKIELALDRMLDEMMGW